MRNAFSIHESLKVLTIPFAFNERNILTVDLKDFSKYRIYLKFNPEQLVTFYTMATRKVIFIRF